MKTKVIYYSQSGNAQLVSTKIAEQLDAQLIQLKPVKEFPTAGFKKYAFGGKSVLFKDTPPLEKYDKSLEYDLLILATPIWAGTFSPPMRTFLSENDLAGKKVAFFACHGGSGAEKCFEEFKRMQPAAILLSTLDLNNPKKDTDGNGVAKAVSWAKKVADGIL